MLKYKMNQDTLNKTEIHILNRMLNKERMTQVIEGDRYVFILGDGKRATRIKESVVKKFDTKISSLIDIISIPDYEGDLVSLTYLIPLQLLSYHLAKNKSLSIDQPRNLAKVVTVE